MSQNEDVAEIVTQWWLMQSKIDYMEFPAAVYSLITRFYFEETVAQLSINIGILGQDSGDKLGLLLSYIHDKPPTGS